MKLKRLRLSKVVSSIFVMSGLFQCAVMKTHIDMIVNLFSTIIGFYLFVFILTTVINILNGTNFSSKKSKLNIFSAYFITVIQIIIGILFILTALKEVDLIAEVSLNARMIKSFVFMGVSMLASIIACVVATVFYYREEEMDMYLG